MPPLFLRSVQVARQLGVSYEVLHGLIRRGLLQPPVRDSANIFIWLPEDVARARQALASRRRPGRPAAALALSLTAGGVRA